MAWKVELRPNAEKQLDQLDPQVARRILKFLSTRLLVTDNPRSIGAALTGPLSRYWKYRVGDYRLICDIQDGIITILILDIGNRREVYR